ncbi:MAG: hypothetical protein NVS2B16_26910 [Chloroflexota bacterium]
MRLRFFKSATIFFAISIVNNASALEYSFTKLSYDPVALGIPYFLSGGTAGEFLDPRAINDHGDVVGLTGNAETDTLSFIYSASNQTYSRISFGSEVIFAVGINNSKVAFGYYPFASDPTPQAPGVLSAFTTDSGLFRIPSQPNALFSGGINDLGQIVGSSGSQGFFS